MTLKDIIKYLIEAIQDNQVLNGIQNSDIEVSTCPMRDLDHFDSLNALEVLTDLEITIESEYDTECTFNPILFFKIRKKGKLTKTSVYKSLTIDEIASNIYNAIT